MMVVAALAALTCQLLPLPLLLLPPLPLLQF